MCGRGRRDPFPPSGYGPRVPRWSPAATGQRTRAAWSLPRVPVGPAARDACALDPRALWHTGPRRAEPLAAGRMRGEQLTGIHDPVGVEDAAQPGHEVQIGLAVLEREILGLVETHAVLARDRAAP